MKDFDRLTLEHLTVAFPRDWQDRSEADTTYFESPDGEKGFYLALWDMGEEEQRSPRQLAEVFLAVELDSLLDGSDDRELVGKDIAQTDDGVICTWDTLSCGNLYRVAGKIHARGRYVLRATFHDYHCERYDNSRDYFEPIIGSLSLLEA